MIGNRETMTLWVLSERCGYFVEDCWYFSHGYYCNNGYGCSHPDNEDRDSENCPVHARCIGGSCPLVCEADDSEEGGGDAVMVLYGPLSKESEGKDEKH